MRCNVNFWAGEIVAGVSASSIFGLEEYSGVRGDELL